ncbi:hypothetical protein [Umezawaea sp. Da 62-37]|uniref:hypothetical protein n=1 Tax=Umezawaea sp. Da 62-37 TaxID=3075927 RepID=UPI0028F72079|nr:hypothetical protein [Umezawaea sp. Da 62-37]WNV88866.1 hypothetical protein RM788_11365 [Umezawaea sp. Da 62-37]
MQVLVDGGEFRDADARNRSITEFIANVKLLRVLPVGTSEYRSVAARIRMLGPGLEAAGLFEVVKPRDPEVATLLSG